MYVCAHVFQRWSFPCYSRTISAACRDLTESPTCDVHTSPTRADRTDAAPAARDRYAVCVRLFHGFVVARAILALSAPPSVSSRNRQFAARHARGELQPADRCPVRDGTRASPQPPHATRTSATRTA